MISYVTMRMRSKKLLKITLSISSRVNQFNLIKFREIVTTQEEITSEKIVQIQRNKEEIVQSTE